MENILIVVGIIIVSRAGNEIYQKEGTKAFRAGAATKNEQVVCKR